MTEIEKLTLGRPESGVKMKKKFSIGDKVYHITPESPCGVVLNIKYEYLTCLHEYLVSFSAESESLWYYEHELTSNRQY